MSQLLSVASSWAKSDGTFAQEQMARPEASAQMLLAKSDGTFAQMLKRLTKLLASCFAASSAKSDGTFALKVKAKPRR